MILNNAFDSFESKLKWTLYLCIQIYAIWIFKVSAFNSAVFIFCNCKVRFCKYIYHTGTLNNRFLQNVWNVKMTMALEPEFENILENVIKYNIVSLLYKSSTWFRLLSRTHLWSKSYCIKLLFRTNLWSKPYWQK